MLERIFRLLLLASISIAAPVLAQDAKLIDAAKKEGGKVIVPANGQGAPESGNLRRGVWHTPVFN